MRDHAKVAGRREFEPAAETPAWNSRDDRGREVARRFAKTGEVVLVDLVTLAATPLQFGISDLGGWEVPGPTDSPCHDRGLTLSGSYRDLYPTASTLTGKTSAKY